MSAEFQYLVGHRVAAVGAAGLGFGLRIAAALRRFQHGASRGEVCFRGRKLGVGGERLLQQLIEQRVMI
jgi:hypothetical protein